MFAVSKETVFLFVHHVCVFQFVSLVRCFAAPAELAEVRVTVIGIETGGTGGCRTASTKIAIVEEIGTGESLWLL